MSDLAQRLLRQAKEGNITKALVDKFYSLKKITKAEYDEICKAFKN